MATSQAEQKYLDSIWQYPVIDGDPNNTANAIKQVDAYVGWATTDGKASTESALKLFLATIAAGAEKAGKNFDEVYSTYPDALKKRLIYTPDQLDLNQQFTIAGVKIQLGAQVGYLLGLAASVFATILLRSRLPGWARFPPLLIALYGVTGFFATFSQTVSTIINNWNDVIHWGPLILQGQLQDLEKGQRSGGLGGGSTSGGGPYTIIRMVEEKKPKQFLGTLFSAKLGKLEHFDRTLDDEITSMDDLEADVAVNVNKWLKTLPGRLGYSIVIRKDPVDETGAQQSGIWATATLHILQLAGKILPIDTILLGPVTPEIRLELARSTKTIEVKLDDILKTEEIREINIPAGIVDIFNKDGDRVFLNGDTTPAPKEETKKEEEKKEKWDLSNAVVISSNQEIATYKARGWDIRSNPGSSGTALAVPPFGGLTSDGNKNKSEDTSGSGNAGSDRSSDSITSALATGGTLKRGSKGKAVSELQILLNNWGSNLTVDGDFGFNTDAEVRKFQSANGLLPDGIVGPKTKEKLFIRGS